jgi:DeoR/GlpR family transcriptional regulator of sugar metabolism
VIHTGGQLDYSNQSCVGSLAVATLRQVVIDMAFISIFIQQSPYNSGLCRFWGLGIGAAF